MPAESLESTRAGRRVGVNLSHERVIGGSAEPELWIWFLHGIYGAGRNWGSIARRVTRERADWGALLVDLRQHGASQGLAPPHTIAAAADDLARLAEAEGTPATVLGHSFGGKVALAYAAAHGQGLHQVWVVDSTPDAGEPRGSAWRMLETLRALPDSFRSRDDLVATLEAAGQDRGTAQWMATNVEHRDGAYRWRFDLDALEELLRDFYRTDLWQVVEQPPAGVALRFVKASESSVLTPEAVARIERAAGDVALHEVQGGHWLNADNPDALVSLLTRELPAARG
jgi:pimeloyl-ACP methyl ester carboxylesterase